MHFHKIHNEKLSDPKIFNCAIRDDEELRTECVEIHPYEELHYSSKSEEKKPLLRYDENGFWAWMPTQNLWWPLRNSKIKLALDSMGVVRIRFYDQ